MSDPWDFTAPEQHSANRQQYEELAQLIATEQAYGSQHTDTRTLIAQQSARSLHHHQQQQRPPAHRRDSTTSLDAELARETLQDDTEEKTAREKKQLVPTRKRPRPTQKNNNNPGRPQKRTRVERGANGNDNGYEQEDDDTSESDSKHRAGRTQDQKQKRQRGTAPSHRARSAPQEQPLPVSDAGLNGEDLNGVAAAAAAAGEVDGVPADGKRDNSGQPFWEPVNLFPEEEYFTDEDEEADEIEEDVGVDEKLAAANGDLDNGIAEDIFGVNVGKVVSKKKQSRRPVDFCFLCSYSATNPNGDTIPMYGRLLRSIEALVTGGASDTAIVAQVQALYERIRETRPSLPVWKERSILKHLYDHAPNHLLNARRTDRVLGRIQEQLVKGQVIERNTQSGHLVVNGASTRLLMQIWQTRQRIRQQCSQHATVSTYYQTQ